MAVLRRLYTVVFALGAALARLAGALIGPIQSVQVGMGEPVLIMAFVVVVIGGIGSITGALVGALLVGVTDTLGRFLLPILLRGVTDQASATSVGSALASMLIYILMAVVLVWRPPASWERADVPRNPAERRHSRRPLRGRSRRAPFRPALSGDARHQIRAVAELG